MKRQFILKSFLAASLLLSLTAGAIAQSAVLEKNVRAHMEFLASDAMQGRGSGTEFEKLAGLYLASMMQQFGIEPAGDRDAAGRAGHLQTIEITRNFFSSAPSLTYRRDGVPVTLSHGKEILALRVSGPFSGPIKRVEVDGEPTKGAVAFVRWAEGDDGRNAVQRVQALMRKGAAAVVVEETAQWRAGWQNLGSRRVGFTSVKNLASDPLNIVVVSKESAEALASLPDGTNVEFGGALSEPQIQYTWNAVGKISGKDPRRASESVLLSAHMDHVGVRPNAPGPDKIFNGADDDASGCVAVLELARILAQGKRPARTVYFAFFGSEEAGGFGSQYFAGTLSFPIEKLIANLQFEMLGRPDEKVKPGELWLTGYERSDLGVTLAKRGARLVADPHPDQNFFQRSDNYNLARKGVVAHTVSSFGLHKDYHQPSDEVSTIDFTHMTQSIQSMVVPVKWLVNSDFRPAWYEGKKP
jgi:hypothetical protein